jgi:hypothetical protein
MQAVKRIATGVPTVIFCSLLILQLAPADSSKAVYDKGIVHFEQYESTPERYSQNPEKEYWEKLKNPNFPLTLTDWRLVTNPRSSGKYMDKRIIGTVKNSSEKQFSEVKIEFMVFDEEGNQIAIVFSNFYNLKPRGIWKFEIPVTTDVGKAELKGLYIPEEEFTRPGKKVME